MKYLLIALVALLAVGMLASSGYAAIDSGSILGIWLFEDEDGEVAADSSENGFDGIIAGGAQFAEGKFGEAIELDGIDDHVTFGNDERLKPQTFTVVAWFNATKASGHRHIFQSGHDWDDMAGIVFRVTQDGNFAAGVTQGPGNTVSWVSGPVLKIDTWYHGALTSDGQTINMYLDGVKIASAGGAQVLYDDRPVRVGSHTDQNVSLFGGLIDEFGYFNEALEAEDIVKIMNMGLEEAVNLLAVSSAGKLATKWADVKVWD